MGSIEPNYKIQYRVTPQKKERKKKKKNPSLLSKLNSLASTFSVLTKCPGLLAVYFFNANRLLCFPHRFVNRGFWRKTFHSLNRGGNQEILFAFMEKIEAGGELNCMSRGLGCDDKAAAAGK